MQAAHAMQARHGIPAKEGIYAAQTPESVQAAKTFLQDCNYLHVLGWNAFIECKLQSCEWLWRASQQHEGRDNEKTRVFEGPSAVAATCNRGGGSAGGIFTMLTSRTLLTSTNRLLLTYLASCLPQCNITMCCPQLLSAHTLT